MNRRQKIIVSITGIFIILLALVGLTYAYFLTRITGNENDKSISVTTANLQLLYEDDTNEVVTVEKLMPSDTVYTKSFTVKNQGNANIDYGVYLINVINTFERKDDIKYTMECTTDGTLPCGAVASETTFPCGISELSTATIEPQKTHTYIFKFTYKDSGTDQSVDMNKKLEAKIQIFGERGDGTILPYEESTLAYNIINNAINKKSETLFVNTLPSKVAEEISSNNWDLGVEDNVYYYGRDIRGYAESEDVLWDCYIVGSSESCDLVSNYTECDSDVKGKYVWDNGDFTTHYVSDCEEGTIVTGKTKYERVLATTEDDYGTSYYYRGSVKDNYVNFANMCWRIVRIAGDGSIKLILDDSVSNCDTEFSRNPWYIYSSPYSVSQNFGYSYKNVDSDSNYEYIMNYLNPSGDPSTTMMKAFYDFQTTGILKNYTDKLKVGGWCLGDIAYKRSGTSGSFTYTPLDKYDYSEYMYYDSYTRLITGNANGYQPTLKCNGTKLNNFLDVVYTYSDGIDEWTTTYTEKAPMYVATLTADEIVFAGGSFNVPNTNYYLMNDFDLKSHDGSFYTLSPSMFDGTYDKVFMMGAEGQLSSDRISLENYNTHQFYRPSVSLKSGIIATTKPNTNTYGMPGTKNNPYVIE